MCHIWLSIVLFCELNCYVLCVVVLDYKKGE